MSNWNEISSRVSAPLWQQATDWLREKYRIEVYCFDYYRTNQEYKPQYDCRVNGHQLSIEGNSHSAVILYNTYYEAMEKAIEEALTLIK
jgi:hypothetical protein